MSLNPESKYPTRLAYVVKLRGDATREALTGRLENLITGHRRVFASADELLESLAGDLELGASERPSDGGLHESSPATDHTATKR